MLRKAMFALMFTLLLAGCGATRMEMTDDQAWPDDRRLTRLERQVDDFTGRLVGNIAPGRVYLGWYDNQHPKAPLLQDAYVVSMVERSLTRRGFVVNAGDGECDYRLTLVLTPDRKVMLALGQLSCEGTVLSTAECSFVNREEKWNRSLVAHRYRERTVIPLRGEP